MNYHEIEVKFHVETHEKVIKKINKLQIKNLGKQFETNICYENINRKLVEKKFMLRLRKTNKITLTLKKEPKFVDKEFKINEEFEIITNDFDMTNTILNELGYYRELTYEKWRETWETGKTAICLDTMPYGSFVEIEGPPEEIKSVASKLNLNWEKRIIASYLEIFKTIKKKESLPFKNLTFDKFNGNNNLFEKYSHQFEAKTAPQPTVFP